MLSTMGGSLTSKHKLLSKSIPYGSLVLETEDEHHDASYFMFVVEMEFLNKTIVHALAA